MSEQEATGAEPGQPIEAAQADLERLRDMLQRAAQGQADPTELKGSVQDYLSEHGPVLRTAAASLTEQARLQLLDELYKWRGQLDEQLQQRKGSPPPGTGAAAEAEVGTEDEQRGSTQ